MATAETFILTGWLPPNAITGLNVEAVVDLSYISLTWDVSGLADEDFSAYRVYRREQPETDWEMLASITDKATTTYLDAFAGHGLVYEYKVTQLQIVVGSEPLESGDGDVVAIELDADSWFVIGNANVNDSANSFELPVVDESHNDVVQQEIFEPVASVRKKIVRGNVLGQEGSLDLMWEADERAEARLRLRFMTDNPGPHLLKSPFGEMWLVEFDAPSYKYKSVGHLTASVGWVEVEE
jgi:hypothetical protein